MTLKAGPEKRDDRCIGDRLHCLSVSDTPNDYELRINSEGNVMKEEGDGICVRCSS